MAWLGRWDAESSITVGKHENTPGVGCGEGRDADFLSFCGVFCLFVFPASVREVSLCGFAVNYFTSVLENAEELG